MVDSTSETKEVIEAELTAQDLNNLAEGWDGVEVEGENFILRLSTETVPMPERMDAVKRAYHNCYDESRRALQDK